MFDIFDIQLPKLALGPGLEVRRCESAFGLSDDEFVFVDGVKFARILPASSAYSNVEVSTGSSQGSNWTVLLVRSTAADAAKTHESWTAFLASLEALLHAQSMWRVVCESDCDQRMRRAVRLSPLALAEHLDSVRRDHTLPIAFEATPP